MHINIILSLCEDIALASKEAREIGAIIIFKHLEEGINSVFERKHYGHSIIHHEENHSEELLI